MDFPTTPVLDDFNRANTGPPPSASWTTDYYGGADGLEVDTNQLKADARYASAYWSTALTDDNAEVYITLASLTGSAAHDVTIALVATDVGLSTYSGYELSMPVSGSWEVVRRDAGVGTTMFSGSQASPSGGKLGLRRIGILVEAWFAPSGGTWTLLGADEDDTYFAPYYMGVYMDGNSTLTMRTDDFGGGAVVFPTFPTTPVLDDFNRADQGPPPGRLWASGAYYYAGGGELEVVSEQLAPGVQYVGGYLAEPITADDVELYVDIAGGFTSPADLSLAFITSGAGTNTWSGYECYAQPGGYVELSVIDAGVYTGLRSLSSSVAIAAGDSLAARRYGEWLELWHKPAAGTWYVLLQVQDNSWSGPYQVGLHMDGRADLTERLDNLGAGPVGVARYLVDADFTSSAGETFRLGYSTFGGSAPITNPLTATFGTDDRIDPYAMRASIRRGRDGQLETVRAGECAITLSDPSGRFNPANASSDLYGLVRPMRQVRVRYDDGAGGTYGLFRGFIRNVTHDAARDVLTTTLTCSDLLWYMDRSRPTIGTVSSVTAGTAIGLVLDAVGWTDSTLRDLDDDGIVLASFGASGDTSALELVRRILEADRGEFFVAGDGKATYRGRNYRYSQLSAGTFSDSFVVARPQVDVEAMVNTAKVVMTTDAGVATGTFSYSDADSVAAYGYLEAPEVQTSYLSGTADAQSLAGYIVALSRDAVSPISMRLFGGGTAMVVQQAARELGDVVTIASDQAAIGTAEFFVEAIDHDISDGGHYHATSWVLSPDPSGTAGVFIIGTSTIDGAAGLGY